MVEAIRVMMPKEITYFSKKFYCNLYYFFVVQVIALADEKVDFLQTELLLICLPCSHNHSPLSIIDNLTHSILTRT